MIGSWRGKGVETGHPIDGLLERFGWHGKRFTGPDGAHPLVFEQTNGGVFSVNPAMIPVGFVLRHADLFRHPLARRLFRAFGVVLRTDQPKARLRMTEYRGVVSATMIYDSLPINDICRKVDDDTVWARWTCVSLPSPFSCPGAKDVKAVMETLATVAYKELKKTGAYFLALQNSSSSRSPPPKSVLASIHSPKSRQYSRRDRRGKSLGHAR